MSTNPTAQPRVEGRLIAAVVMTLLVAGLVVTQNYWLPQFNSAVAYLKNESPESGTASTAAWHDENAPDHVAHDEGNITANLDSIKLTQAAWTNIGLITGVVETSDFARSTKVPAIVVERPGRSLIHVPAPVTGVVTKVFVAERDSVLPGQPLFELRLTHEDVVTAQTSFLEHLHHEAASKRELDRLEAIGSEIIAGKRIIEQRYKYEEEAETVEGLRQNLLMHGLSEAQVAAIESSRELLRTMTVAAPPFDADEESAQGAATGENARGIYHLRELEVSRGAIVAAGHRLAVLADHRLLFVEGQAFEDDAKGLFRAAADGERISVVPSAADDLDSESLSLEIQSVSDHIDPDSRALKFYLLLPNERLSTGESTKRFLGWKYRPGQRMEAALRTDETFKDIFLFPTDAVVIDGPNAFIFEQNGDNFDRVDVSVLYRDQDSVVVKRDGRLIGSVIAMTAAFDLHLALKNAVAGPVDPHAGHTH